MKGTIILKGLQYFISLGVTEQERKNKQPVLIDLKITFSMAKAVKTQALQDSVDYSTIQETIANFIQEKKYILLERLANDVADHLLLSFPKIDSLICRAWKPHAFAKEQAENVGVEIRKKQIVRETGFSY